MKPVQLLPTGSSTDAVVAKAGDAKPNLGLIGGIAAVVIAGVVVGGYFAMARVDSVKSEKAQFETQAASAQAETQATRAKIATLGKPIVDSDRQIAQGAEQVLVSAYTERRDYVMLAKELSGIMQGTGGWYTSVKVTSGGADGESKAVVLEGYMPSEELAASFNERADSTLSMLNASTVKVSSERLANPKNRRLGVYWKFTLEADFDDLAAPSAGATGGDGASTPGTTVSGGDDGGVELTLEPEPVTVTKKKVVVAPKNPFALAASNAGGTK